METLNGPRVGPGNNDFPTALQRNPSIRSKRSDTIDETLQRNPSIRSRRSDVNDEAGSEGGFYSPTLSDASPTRQPWDNTYNTCSLHKSNSTASARYSIRSHNSVRVTGHVPFGKLRVHRVDSSDSVAAMPDMIGSITEEDTSKHFPFLNNGDVFRIIDLPDDFVVGLDSMSMTTSKSLAGFRDIPQGAHFLWVQQPDHNSRSGYWFVTRGPGQIRMKQWDKFNEVLGDVVSRFEVREQTERMTSLYPEMKPYNLSEMSSKSPNPGSPALLRDRLQFQWAYTPTQLWRTLTDAISTRFLARITSKRDVEEFHVDSMDCVKGEIRPTRDLTGITCDLDFLTAQTICDVRALGRTSHISKDTTKLLLALLEYDDTNDEKNRGGPIFEDDIVAELQFTFISGTYLGNSACLDQWWNMVLKIVLRATNLVTSRPILLSRFFRTLHAELFFTEEFMEAAGENAGESATDAVGPKGDRLLYLYKPQMRSKLLKSLVLCKKGLVEEFKAINSGGRVMGVHQGELFRVWSELLGWLRMVGWDITEGDMGDGEGQERVSEDREGAGDSDSEDDDDRPVIIELDEDGREVGLVNFRD